MNTPVVSASKISEEANLAPAKLYVIREEGASSARCATWRTWGRRGDGLTTVALARLLRPYGVRPALTGPAHRVSRYAASALRDACVRMAPSERVGAGVSLFHPGAGAPVSVSSVGAETVRGSHRLTEGVVADAHPPSDDAGVIE